MTTITIHLEPNGDLNRASKIVGGLIVDVTAADLESLWGAEAPLIAQVSAANAARDAAVKAQQAAETARDRALARVAELEAASSGPVVSAISRRQCAIAMMDRGMISDQEAIDMAQWGEPPGMVAALFAALPEDQATRARLDFAAIAYQRDNPLLNAMLSGPPINATAADIDAFFAAAAAL